MALAETFYCLCTGKLGKTQGQGIYVYSLVQKDQQDTFIFAFPYCDIDKEIIMEVHELLIKVIVT